MAIVSGGISGVIFGGFMGPLFARQRRKMSALLGDLPRRELKVASRAVMRGPVPLDPDIRQAAVLLATHQLKGASRLRWLGVGLFSVFAVFSAILALTDSPWWWTTVAIWAAAVAAYLMWPRHLKRRIAILNQDS